MTKPYERIACALHDEYEIAIMHKKHLSIKWLDGSDKQHTAKILPIDILVKNKEEFLVARTHDSAQDNKEFCIRLDKVTLLADQVDR
jgi:transcriptional antiterminator Rof (Rho-off)